MRSYLVTSAAVASLAAAALSGCGGSSHSGNGIASKAPDAVFSAALAAANGAHAVHISGSIVSGGTPITLDMHLTAGAGGRGQVSENGVSFQLVNLGQTVYLNGTQAFWTKFAGAATARRLAGRWLKASATSASFGSLTALTDFRRFFAGVLGRHGTLAKRATTTVNGQRVVPLDDTSQGGTLYVAASGPTYPIGLEKRGAAGGRVIFDQWNQPVSLSAPANALDATRLNLP